MTPRRALTDEQRALLERLVAEAGPRIHAYVKRAFPRLDADEAVAETFARAAQGVSGLEQSADPVFYLLRTARNACLRELQRPRAISIPEAGVSGAPPGPTDADAEADEVELLSAVASLPDGQREVVVLRVSAELSFAQIAALLEIPLGTALSRMNAALRNLRRRLERVR